jgi:hypothetical protein
MIELIGQIIGLWALAVVVYFKNPLNDPSNPESLNCYYHPLNCLLREAIQKHRKALATGAGINSYLSEVEELRNHYDKRTTSFGDGALASRERLVNIDCICRTGGTLLLCMILRWVVS